LPLFYQHNINDFTKLGIWKIEEDEDFFLKQVPLKREVTHPHKRLQHLAGRYLLPFLFPDFPLSEILIADTRKPFLQNEKYHFSISHCGDYAAAIVSSNKRVGIDIETVSAKIDRVQHKFLGENEYNIAFGEIEELARRLPGLDIQLLTVLWSAKEATFKWYGEGKVDFKANMQLSGQIRVLPDQWICLPFIFDKGTPVGLYVHSTVLNNLVLSWIMS
jgi:4'-phosphopantetheinyl transferase EntD